MSRVFTAALLLSTLAAAQEFTPRMPGSVPPAPGAVVTGLTLRYIEIAQGTGDPAAPGKQYTVHYTGWLRDGTKFDSSVGKDPLQFVQGRRQVIPGFDSGFEGMKVGGKRRVFIPYQLAYGELGRGPIPPKAELIFDVELLAVKEPPAHSPADDLMLTFNMDHDQIMALAKAVPEDKYDWRPAQGVRSFRELFLHIVYAINLQLKIADGISKADLTKELEKQVGEESAPLPKDQVLKKLEEAMATAKAAFETAKTGSLGRDIDFFGAPTTQRGIYDFVDAHMSEHLGQAIAYARMNGIVPPWSR